MLNFLDIPEALLLEIVHHMDEKSKVTAASTNRALTKAVNNYLNINIKVAEVEAKEICHKKLLNQAGRTSLQIKTTAEHLQLMKLTMNALLDYLAHDNPPPISERPIYSRWLPGYTPNNRGFFSRIRRNFYKSSWKGRQKAYHILKWLPHTDDMLSLIILLHREIKENEPLKRKLLPLIINYLEIPIEEATKVASATLQRIATAPIPISEACLTLMEIKALDTLIDKALDERLLTNLRKNPHH